MAEKGINIPLKVDGATQFKRDISSATTELKKMKSALALVEQENKGVANTYDSLKRKLDAQERVYESNKKKIDALAKTIDAYKKAQEDAEKAVEDAKKTHGEESKEYEAAQRKLQSLTTSVDKYETQLNRARTEQDAYGREIEETKGALDEAEKSQDNVADSIDEMDGSLKDAGTDAKSMVGHLTKMEAIEKIADVVSDAFGRLGDALDECDAKADAFEYKMAQIKTIADSGSIDSITKDIKAMSLEFGQSAEELGESVYQSISASVDTEEATGFVEDASKLAIGGFTDTTTAVDVLTTAINAYGKETKDASHISDVLVKTQKLGKTTVGQLGASMGQVIPTASALGVDIEQLATGYVLLTRNGIDTASATTYLSGMFTELGRDGTTVSDILKDKTGKSFGQLLADGKDLSDVMDILGEAVGGDAEAFSNLWSNVRAGRAANTLFKSGMEEFKSVLDEVTYSAGATEEAFDIMASTGEMAEKRLEAAKDGLKMAIGEALSPVEDKKNELLTQFFTDLTEKFEELPDNAKTALAVIAEIGTTAAAAAPQVLSFITQLTTLRAAQAALKASNTGATGGTGKFVAALKKIGPAASVAGAAIGALVFLYASYKSNLDEATKAEREYAESVGYMEAAQAERHDRIETLLTQDNKYRKKEDAMLELEQLRTETQDELTAALQNRAKAHAELAAAQKRQQEQEAYMEGGISGPGEFGSLGDYTDGTPLEEGTESLAKKIEYWQQALDSADATIKTAAGDISLINDGLMQMGIECGNTAAVVSAAGDTMSKSMQFSIETAGMEALAFSQLRSEQQLQAQGVVDAYNFMQEAIANAVDLSINSFGDLGEDAKITVGEMTQSIIDETNRLSQWETDLATLLEKGVSPDIVAAFATAGVESQAYVDALLAASDQDIQDLNAAYADKLDLATGANDAGQDLITEFTEIKAGGETALQELAESLGTKAYDAGGNINKGLIEGLETAIEDVTNAGMEVGEASIDGLREGAGEHSPSIYARVAGRYVDEGLANGIDERAIRPKNAATKLGTAVISSLRASLDTGRGQVNASAAAVGQSLVSALARTGAEGTASRVGTLVMQSLTNGLSAGAGSAPAVVHDVMARIIGALNVNAEGRAYQTGAAISQGVAAGINDYASLAVNAAVQLATRTLQQVQTRLKIHSPSQVFAEEVGAMIPAGIAEGFNEAMDLNIDSMAERFNRSINGIGRIASVNNVYVYIGDRELTTMMTQGVVKQINGGIRAYSASQGR